MLPELDEISTLLTFIVIVVVGVAGLFVLPIDMETNTILYMVLPSMLVFGGVMLMIGIAHGKYRGAR